MNIKDKLIEVKRILMGIDSIKVELASIKMLDGTELKYDKLEVGGIVTLVSEDGTESPLPAGSYDLEDGFTIEVDENGVITKYDTTPEKPVEEPVAQEQITQSEEAPVEAVSMEMVTGLENRISELEKAISEMLNLSKEMAESTQTLSKKIDMSTDAKPIKKIKEVSKSENKIENIKQILSGLKK